jgi:hypothetical protein
VHNLESRVASGPVDMPAEVDKLRRKVAQRELEGNISPDYAEMLDSALSDLATAV